MNCKTTLAISILLFACYVALIEAITTNRKSNLLRSRNDTNVEPLLHLDNYDNTSSVGENVSGPWSVCIGLDCDDCIDIIKYQAADIKTFHKVYPGMVVTMDYVTNRVRLYVEWDCIVTRAPMRG